MSDPLADPYPLRLPPGQRVRLEARARAAGVTFAALLRRYIDAGDRADTRRERRADTPHEETTP